MVFSTSHQALMTSSAIVSHRSICGPGHVHQRWCRQPAAQLQTHRGHVHMGHRQVICAGLATETLQLKEELFKAIETGKREMKAGNLTPEVESIVQRIKSAAEASPMQPKPGMIDGRFDGLLNTTNYMEADSTSTLGTLTFQQFQPRDLKVKVSLSEVVSGEETPDQYQTNTYFTVTEGEGEGLEGMQSALGTYDIDPEKTYRQNVYFSAIRIAPAPGSSEEALQQWRAVFGPGNPSMGKDGAALVEFPQRVKGTRDFILVDEEIQVTEGNRGSLVIIRRRQG